MQSTGPENRDSENEGGKRMRKYMAWPVTALLVCLAAGFVYAGYDQAMGTIKMLDVDGGRITIAEMQFGGDRNAPAKEVTYLIDKDTTVQINREKKELKDLAEGKMVTLFFKEADKAGDLPKALLITVRDRAGRGGAGGGAGGAGGGGGRGGAGGAGN